MLDEKGSLYIMEAILAIVLLLAVFLIVNTVISIPGPDYSYQTNDFKTSQDIMQTLGGKVYFSDRTFLGEISGILKDGKNSKESIRKVSNISKNKFDNLKIKNYRFSESNILDDEVLASSGDFSRATNVSVATRTYGDYYYTLSVW